MATYLPIRPVFNDMSSTLTLLFQHFGILKIYPITLSLFMQPCAFPGASLSDPLLVTQDHRITHLAPLHTSTPRLLRNQPSTTNLSKSKTIKYLSSKGEFLRDSFLRQWYLTITTYTTPVYNSKQTNPTSHRMSRKIDRVVEIQ